MLINFHLQKLYVGEVMLFCYFILFLLLYLRQNLILKSRPARCSLCSPCWPHTSCLSLSGAGDCRHMPPCLAWFLYFLTCVLLLSIIILRFFHVLCFHNSFLFLILIILCGCIIICLSFYLICTDCILKQFQVRLLWKLGLCI